MSIISRPFKRVQSFMAALSSALAISSALERQVALADLGQYQSRGKGKNRPSYARGRNRNSHNIVSEPNGERAVARRLRQIQRGILQHS